MKKEIIYLLIVFIIGVLLSADFIYSESVNLPCPPLSERPLRNWYDLKFDNQKMYDVWVLYPENNEAIIKFNEIKNDYIQAKELCGLGINFDTDYSNFTSKLLAKNPSCEKYLDYVLFSRDGTEFMRAYYKYYPYPTNKSDFNKKNLKEIYTQKWTNRITILPDNITGPFFVVMELTNSTDEIYFSDLIDIPFSKANFTEYDGTVCNNFNKYELNIFNLNLNKENHKLIMNFDNKLNIINKSNNTSIIFISLIIIVIVIIIMFIFFSRKRNKK